MQDAVAEQLSESGHDANHVRALGMGGATDHEVMERARTENRVLVTTDTDFGRILALAGTDGPSVVLLRGIGDTIQDRMAALLRALPLVVEELTEGAIVVVEDDRYRVRTLPIE